MRVLTTILTAIALAGAVSAGQSVPDASAASRAPARNPARAASEHDKGPSCKLVTAGEIKTVLGLSVGQPIVNGTGPSSLCIFRSPKGQDLIVRVETGMSRSDFQVARRGFDSHGQQTKDFAGLGIPAYSSVLVSRHNTMNTLVALKASTELMFTGPFPLGKLAALAKRILPEM